MRTQYMQRIAPIFLFMLFLVCAPLASIADEKIGVVLMHGTQGTSGQKSPLGPLLRAFRKAGILYAAPDMPWSRRRHLSKTVEESLLEIDKAVEGLKAKGATKIVVGGPESRSHRGDGLWRTQEGPHGHSGHRPGTHTEQIWMAEADGL